jgi:uncharacterized membrane protein YhaH (DUF805 family)
MSEDNDEWYLSRGGETFGPVTFAEVRESARAGRIEPRTDMLLGGDLKEWTPAAAVPGVFEKDEPGGGGSEGAEGGAAATDEPSAAAPESMAAGGSYDESERVLVHDLPGANRLGYFCGVFILPPVVMFALIMVVPTMAETVGQPTAAFLPLLFLAPLIFALVVTVKRFQNLAMSGWWIFGLLVPILQWWLNYRLFACPPGYAHTKRLDGLGWVLAVIYWLLVIASVAVMVISGFAALIEFLEGGGWEDLTREVREAREGMGEQLDAPEEDAP